jgi:hypothetical protein
MWNLQDELFKPKGDQNAYYLEIDSKGILFLSNNAFEVPV